MTQPRGRMLTNDENIYHCISRCVRRAYLCGNDAVTKQCFDHRKDWVYERLVFLSGVFTVDVLGYALMSTHSHTMVRTRPDLVASLTNQAVVIRWLKLYPKRDFIVGSKKYNTLVETIASDATRVEVLRTRLMSVSWFMKSLNEYIARKANKEDECKGRFWEGRFKCQRLGDQAAVLSCAVYIDLNPIRAKITETPESSEYTSAYERIKALKRSNSIRSIKEPNLWLSPIQDTANKRGFLSVSLPEYLTILDLSGRELRHGKRGKIPSELAPILERVGIKPNHWLDTCKLCRRWFSSEIGNSSSLVARAKSLNKSWLKGMRAARLAFI